MNSLTNSERDTLFRLLGPKCKSLSSALAQVWMWDAKGNVRKLPGILCLVKDYRNQGFYFRLISLEKNALLWESLIQHDIIYEVEKSYLHTMALQDYSIAFNFADRKEAVHMHKTLHRQVDKLKEYTEDFDFVRDIEEVNNFFKMAEISSSTFREESTRKYIFELMQTQNKFISLKKAQHIDPNPGTDYYSLPEGCSARPKTWVELSFEEDDEPYIEDYNTTPLDLSRLHVEIDSNRARISGGSNNRLSMDILDLLTPPSTPTEAPKSATLEAIPSKNGNKKSWYRKDPQKTKTKTSKITKADIGEPTSFQHVFHSGLDNLNLPPPVVNTEKQTT